LLLIVISTSFFSVADAQNQSYISTSNAIDDINFMIKNIEEIHYNPYFKTSKDEFQKNKTELISSFPNDSVSFRQFIATGMKLAAQLSGGHTSLDWQNNAIFPELMDHKFLPFTGRLTANDSTFIISDSAEPNIKIGTKIISINGVNIIDIYGECMSYIGGIESYKKEYCTSAFPLYAYFTNLTEPPYQIVLENDTIISNGISVNQINEFLGDETLMQNYTFEIINDSIGLIKYNSCTEYDSFKVFLAETFSKLEEKKITKLIIDISKNPGGDSKLNDLLLSYITKQPYRQSSGRFWKVSNQAKTAYKGNHYEDHFGTDFMNSYYNANPDSIIETVDEELTYPKSPRNSFEGKTCFIISPSTFSSANFLADAIKTYNLSILIGSATGELTNDFGEVISLRLPSSGNYFYVSSTYDIGANGNPTIFEPVYPDIKSDEPLKTAINWLNRE